MASVIDLTEDSPSPGPIMYSADESRASKQSNTIPPMRLPPLSEILNHAQPRPQAYRPVYPSISQLLVNAIDTVDESSLRTMIKEYCAIIPELRERIENKLLARGKDIVRYHDGDESEGKGDVGSDSDGEGYPEESESEEDTEEDSEEDSEEKPPREKIIKPIATADDELLPRFAKCLNCEEDFDIIENTRGDCRWHDGEKEENDDDDFWADHDERIHGYFHDLEDDPNYAEGFKWSCCGKLGNDEGCKRTKHKADVNMIVYSPVAGKRKAQEDLPRPERSG